jgi:2-dehydro-3-deoxyphosphogluconate aldolase/(4S)-4-hydroxy-2-oxoglutarate aldolase
MDLKGAYKMNTFSRLDVLNTIINEGLVPIFYHSDVNIAKKVIDACLKGGSRIFEFVHRGKFSTEVFKELSSHCQKVAPDSILGVGTIFEEHTASIFVSYGANFIVSPFLNENIAKFCNRRKIPYIPGCATVTEISKAEELGVEFIKLYPGSYIGGPGYVKMILGPMPWTRIIPTGGIDPGEESITEWFNSGVAAVGIGSKLLRKDLIAKNDYEQISKNISQLLSLIKELKKKNRDTK